MIPKIIHYCWLSNDPIPKEFEEYMNSWKEKLPDYNFIKWDFSNFDKESSIWVTEAFDNKKYAFACDYIRLYAVYNYGGIYMDMDIEVLKKFDDLLDSQYMMATERPGMPWIEAGCFGAEAHSPFIFECLNYYNNRHFVINGEFDQKPLPQVMYEVYTKLDFNIDFKDWKTFTAKSYETGKVEPNENTYSIHHFAGSWKTIEEIKAIEDSQKYSRLFGLKIGHNIADYKYAIKKNGIKGMYIITKEKLQRKFKK